MLRRRRAANILEKFTSFSLNPATFTIKKVLQSGISQLLSEEMHTKVFWTFLDKKDLTFTTIKKV